VWGKSVSVSLQVLFVPRSILVKRCQLWLAYEKNMKKEKIQKKEDKKREDEKERKKGRRI
jgi:hypothetical protein